MTAPLQRRRLLLLSGDPAWGEQWLLNRLGTADLAGLVWLADTAPAGIDAVPASRIIQRLGGECRLLVCNAHQGFHPDAFAAAVGMLRGGGDCVVLAPPLDAWPAFADPDKQRFACHPRRLEEMHGHFLARLVRCWRDHPAARLITPDDHIELQPAPEPPASLVLNDEQRVAVSAVERVAHGHARRPLVLTADRGRGKSTVLGVAAARLLLAGMQRISVVAAHRAAARTLYAHALATAGLAAHEPGDVTIGGGRLCFRLPAECLAETDEAPGLVLVDEAAAIPVAVLSRLLAYSNRLVFASTVHGYEGSGRGFELRFRSVLNRQMPQWRGLRLSAPVRWAADDPLERLLSKSFLLDADLGEPDVRGELHIAPVDSDALAADEPLLRATFGLLINAHYQTRPSDLRQLLDDPDSHLWLARRGGAVLGVLQVSAEGGLDTAIAEQIVSGRRRPRGHLLPQSLAVHAGLDACLSQQVLRVQRIAVHPLLQRHGIGRRLLDALVAWAARRDIDLLGCAFGADPPLVGFWRAAGFVPARLGVRIDPASAAHSLFMLRGLSASGRALVAQAEGRFQRALPWSLAGSLRTLDSALAALLLQGRDCGDLALDADSLVQLARVASGVRQPATAEDLVWKALLQIAARATATGERLAPLLAWVLQHHAAEQVCRQYAIDGRHALDTRLRELLAEQLNTLWSSG